MRPAPERKPGRFNDPTAPDIPRTKYGTPIWSKDPWEAWTQLCDLARVAPDTPLGPDELVARLRAHGEMTRQSTVERIWASVTPEQN